MNYHLLHINHSRSFTKTVSSSQTQKKIEFSIRISLLQTESRGLEKLCNLAKVKLLESNGDSFKISSVSTLPIQTHLQACHSLECIVTPIYYLTLFSFSSLQHTNRFFTIDCPIFVITYVLNFPSKPNWKQSKMKDEASFQATSFSHISYFSQNGDVLPAIFNLSIVSPIKKILTFLYLSFLLDATLALFLPL